MSNIKIKTCKALYGIDDKNRYSIDNYSDFVEDKNKKFIDDLVNYLENIGKSKYVNWHLAKYFKFFAGKNLLKKMIKEIMIFHFPILGYIVFKYQ